MSAHTAVFAVTVVGLAALLGAAFAPGEIAALRAAAQRARRWLTDFREQRQLPDPWTGDELRAMRLDLVAERSRRDRRRNPYQAHRCRQRLRHAGFRFAGGPLGRLP